MMRRSLAAIVLLLVAACGPKAATNTTPMTTPTLAETRFDYPDARRTDVVDDYHGTKVADPYRWLEDPDSAETKAWVKAENEVTFAYLESIPVRAGIKKRITELFDFEKYSVPWKEGGRYFWFKNDGLQPQFVLYWSDSLTGTPKVLLDPNTMSADGTVALGTMAVSRDGKRLAYATAEAGSDWNVVRVRDIDAGKDLADRLEWVKFSGLSWTPDGKGFYYSRYPKPKEGQALEEQNYYQALWFHRLGDPQAKDKKVLEFPDHKEWGAGGIVSDDGRYLIASMWKGTGPQNLVWFKDLKAKKAAPRGTPLASLAKEGQPSWVKLVDAWEAEYSFIDNVGTTFYFKTDKDAPRGRVVSVDVSKKKLAWKEVIPQGTEAIGGGVGLVNDLFVVGYLKDARHVSKLFSRDGKFVREVEIPGIGSLSGGGGKRDYTETFFSFTGFTTPSTIYRYDLRTQTASVFKAPKLAFDPANFETKQVFYTSKDGTKVPMFITHKKGLALDGKNPTFLYGYGGFNVPVTPSFSSSLLVWMEMGGIYAVANIRGGSEYGEEWHQGGIREKKQNVFDDFIAGAEWLIENKYTSSEKLAIGGGSNGGLLVGACMTQRPELFRAAIPQVGVLDMMRFHKFTIGWAWVDDYGSSDQAEMVPVLRKYSPLHNLKAGTKYPSTLITTADHDDRVVPAHSFKFAAALQDAHAGENPVLIRIEAKAGHGAGKPTEKLLDEAADRFSFLVQELGVKVPPEIATK